MMRNIKKTQYQYVGGELIERKSIPNLYEQVKHNLIKVNGIDKRNMGEGINIGGGVLYRGEGR